MNLAEKKENPHRRIRAQIAALVDIVNPTLPADQRAEAIDQLEFVCRLNMKKEAA